MSTSLARRRVTASLLTAGLILAVAPAAHTTADAPLGADRLRFSFDQATAGTVLTDGFAFADGSGFANDGVVATAFGGSIAAVADTTGAPGSTGTVLGYPADCTPGPCASAMVQLADDPTLDPLLSDFEWGARILMQPYETADGENIIQKGITDEPGGQWKLQVDKAGGLPSCVVSGRAPGEATDRRLVLRGSVDVADGVWHLVVCRRTAAAGLQLFVDGVVTAAAAMPVVDIDSNAPVTIGANRVTPSPNDQFHGMLDDVFMDAEQTATRPPRSIESVPDAAAALQPAARLPVVDSP
ncbi:MAG: rane protein [Ilumatobacteraceae bacterium]|nr:rane protein [Ilumatobacteraceae bacterium]